MREDKIFQQWVSSIANDTRHPAYKEVVAIAKFWTGRVTGLTDKEAIITVREKETDGQKKLKQRIFNSLARYVTEKINTTYREVDRCDSIKETVTHPAEKALELIQKRARNFYGDDSIDEFNDEFLLTYAGMDPNAYQLINIKPHDPLTQKPSPFPTIIRSKDCRWWSYDINELQYLSFDRTVNKKPQYQLWTKDYSYIASPASEGEPTGGLSIKIKLPKNPNLKLYVWKPGSKAENWDTANIKIPTQGSTDTEEMYYVTRYAHNLGFVPARRLGWRRSFEHKHDVLESYLLPAKERYIELDQKKSTYDTHLLVHGIAKQISYLPTCNYVDKATNMHCQMGSVGEVECPKCEGSGTMPIHYSELDVVTIELPMKDDAVADIIDASKLHQYVEIPKHIIEMHKASCDEAAQDIALALFNTNVFKRAELTAATATEVLQNNKSVDNALYAYGRHRGRTKEWQMKTIAAYLDFGKDFVASFKYPSDYKLETLDELLTRRKLAADAGAPPHVLSCIDEAILNKQNIDEPSHVRYVKVVDSLRPFSAIGEVERLALMGSLPADHPKRLALLYFDDIIFLLDSDKATAKKWFKKEAMARKKLFDDTLIKVVESYNKTIEVLAPAAEEEEEDIDLFGDDEDDDI